MLKSKASIAIAAALAAASLPALAQTPGAADLARVTAGTYKVDANHTQVVWTVNHLGISPLSGAFGASGGTLEIDPAKPGAAKVNVTFDTAAVSVTSPAFLKHLSNAEILNVAAYPTATFTSTSVQASGATARITGNLTLHGVTKPVILDATFYGAGANPMSKKLNIGFTATTSIKRSDFGIGYAIPAVSDMIDLKITAAFTA